MSPSDSSFRSSSQRGQALWTAAVTLALALVGLQHAVTASSTGPGNPVPEAVASSLSPSAADEAPDSERAFTQLTRTVASQRAGHAVPAPSPSSHNHSKKAASLPR